jgi:hypothetical protein
VVIIVAIGAFSEVYRARLKGVSKKSEELMTDFSQRLTRLESRMANLETIVLDKERTKQFSALDAEKD